MNPASAPRWPRRIILLAFTLSGVSGLIYELVWMRRLTLIFGSTTLAVSTVLAALMGGLALGSYLLGGSPTAAVIVPPSVLIRSDSATRRSAGPIRRSRQWKRAHGAIPR